MKRQLRVLAAFLLIISLFFSYSYASTLVGAWDFEDGGPGGVTADTSGVSPALNGVLHGNASIIDDPDRGKVLSPDTYGGVYIGNDTKLYSAQSITVQYWHKMVGSYTGWEYIVGQNGNGPRHFVNSPAGIIFAMQTSDSGWNPINVWAWGDENSWHHVVATYDGENLYGYVDGVLVDTVYRGGTISSHTSKWSIGRIWDDGGNQWGNSDLCNDLIDDVAIWTGYATEGVVQGLYYGTYTIYDAPIGNVDPNWDRTYPAADQDLNGFIDALDLQAVADVWLEDCTQVDCGRADLEEDDDIQFEDFAHLAADWMYDEGTGKFITLEPLLDVPTFKVEGEFSTAGAFSHNWPHPSNVPVKEFADSGTIFQDFGGYTTRDAWLATNPDNWDYSTVDTRMNFLIDPVTGDPNVLAMPWTHFDAPDWWLNDAANQNELEMMVDGPSSSPSYYYSGYGSNPGILPRSGPFPSLASTKWREDMAYAIENFVDYLYQTDQMKNIGGFKLMGLGTGEWYHWSSGRSELAGYGVRTQEAFRDWLRDRYNNDINQLEQAWNNYSINSFNNVTVPSYSERKASSGSLTFRNTSSYMNVIDFELFWNELIVDTVDYFAGVIKQKTNNSKPIGAFYGFMYEFSGSPEFGHNAMGKYCETENLDFMWVTASYHDRVYVTGGDLLRSPSYSLQLNDKLWFNSNDTATAAATHPDILARAAEFGYTDTVAKNKRMFLRSAGFNIANGLMQDWFALHDDWYDENKAPGIMTAAAEVNGIYVRSKNYDRRSASEVLIVSDEASCSYVTYSQGSNALLRYTLAEPQLSLTQMGTPADHILLDDIALLPNPDQYKLVVFLNCWHMTDAQRTLVNSLKGNNRVLMFCYAPGYFNGRSYSEANMESVAGGMDIDVSSETFRRPLMRATTDHPLGTAIRNAGITGNFGPNEEICKRIYVDVASTSNTYRLAYDPYATSNETMAIRDMGTWEAIYAVSPYMPSQVYREIADYAGVHIYNDTSDTFYANKSYVCIHPNHSEGSQQSRTITFPQPVNIYDAQTQALLQSNTTSYTRNYYGGETKVYRYELVP